MTKKNVKRKNSRVSPSHQQQLKSITTKRSLTNTGTSGADSDDEDGQDSYASSAEELLMNSSRNLTQEIREEIESIQCIYEPSVISILKLVPNQSVDDDEDEDSYEGTSHEEENGKQRKRAEKPRFNLVPITNIAKITNFESICVKITLYRHDDCEEQTMSDDEEQPCPSSGRIVLVVQFIKGYPLRPPRVSMEKLKGLSEGQIKELNELIASTIPNLVGTVMVYQLCMICQEYLDSHFYKPEVVPSLHDRFVQDRENRKRLQELELQKLAEQKKQYNDALEKEVLEMRRQRKLKRKQLKQEKQKKLIQHSFASPDVSWDRSRGTINSDTDESSGSEDDELISDSSKVADKWEDTFEDSEEVDEYEDEEEEEDDEDQEAEESDFEATEGSDQESEDEESESQSDSDDEGSTSHHNGRNRFKFNVNDISSESESEEEEDVESYTSEEPSDTTATPSTQDASSREYNFDIQFTDDVTSSEDESEDLIELGSSPIRKLGQIPKPSTRRATSGRASDEQQLLLVHLLHHFTKSNLPNESNAFSDLVDQLQKIGILDSGSNWSDFRYFKQRFMKTFSEQISSAPTKGDAFAALWSAPTPNIPDNSQAANSRYKSDFQELGFLGSGAFGSVIKAKNILDQRIYAVKKIFFPHKDEREEKNILREVNLLSRVHHHNIVRYYNAWREENNEIIELGDEEDDYEDGTAMPSAMNLTKTTGIGAGKKEKTRVLYIQMEYCKETLRELIDNRIFEGSKEEAWRLLRQIVTALSYLHENHIIHRDLKPSNLFVGVDGDVKVGDFGLSRKTSTSSKRLVKSDSISKMMSSDTELSTGIGTPIYTSPELLTSNLYSSKVDMYSLGIIFFEMVHPPFTTGMERLEILKRLRETGKVPDSFPKTYEKEAQLIELLITPDPDRRPSAKELLESDLLPVKMEEEYLRALFAQREEDFMLGKAFNHSAAYSREKATLRFQAVFQLHGAVQFDVTPYLPNSDQVIELLAKEKLFPIITKAGKLVNLTPDGTLSFARYLSRLPENVHFLKRYSFQQTFRMKRGVPTSGHICSFDIVGSTYRLITEAEILKVLSRIIDEFKPKRDGKFVIRINHASILHSVFDLCKIEKKQYENICRICSKVEKLAYSWTYAKNEMINKLGIPDKDASKLIDLLNIKGEISTVHQTLMKVLGNSKARESLTDVATLLGHLDIWPITNCELQFDLSCCRNIHRYDGLVIECGIRRRKFYTPVAYGGRYDRLVSKFAVYEKKPHHVVGINVKLDRLIRETMLVESSGTFIPRAYTSSVPDVIVCSTGRNMLEERMRITDNLWGANIKCDLMYDDRMSLEDVKHFCHEHHIRFIVVTEPNLVSRQIVKVRIPEVNASDPNKRISVVEINKKDLSVFLQNQLDSTENQQYHHQHHQKHAAVAKQIHEQQSSNVQQMFDPKSVAIITNDSKLKQGKQKKVITELAIKHTIEKARRMQSEAHIVAVCMLTCEEIRTAIHYVLTDTSAEVINQAIKDKPNKWHTLFMSVVKHLKDLKAKRAECVYLFIVDDKHKTEFVTFKKFQ